MTTVASPSLRARPDTGVPTRRRLRFRLQPLSIVTAVLGIVLSVALAMALSAIHNDNEDRLLRQRTREAASVLTVAVPSIQAPLAAAVEHAEAHAGGDLESFRRLMEPIVESGTPYVAAALWRVDVEPAIPLIEVGEPLLLTDQPPDDVEAFLQRAATSPELGVIGLLAGDSPRLGYSMKTSGDEVHFVAYAEARVRQSRSPASDSPFSGLEYAIYLGDAPDPDALVAASLGTQTPLRGRTWTELVDFGDAALLLVMSPTEDLGGALSGRLPWMAAIVTIVATVGATTMVERLSRRRRAAETLANANAVLLRQQQSLGRSLQQALVPAAMPKVSGFDVRARYLPGAHEVDVGGDFYDIFESEQRVLVIVGDVSGRGVDAAAVMASLRFSFRAFASRDEPPSTILSGLASLVDLRRDGHFATVLCCALDRATHTITVANAGHPSPLLLVDGEAEPIVTSVGPPIGVRSTRAYGEVTAAVPPGATLLFFTDGLFERRGESIDAGYERLRTVACRTVERLDDLLDELLEAQQATNASDDTAIVGIKWAT